MITGWEQGKKAADRVSGTFFKLIAEGDSAVVVFCGEPVTVEGIGWNDFSQRYEPFDPKVHSRETCRHKLNVYVIELDKMQIWEMAPSTFGRVMAAKDKYGLDKYCFEIKKGSKPGDFTILPEVNKELTAALRDKIKEIPLLSLEAKAADKTDVPF